MMHQDTKLPSHISWRQRLYHGLRALLPTPGNILFMILLISLTLLGQDILGKSTNLAEAEAATTSSGTLIPYQGYLTDGEGTPLDGLYDVTFRIYSESSGGSPLWTEQRIDGNRVQIDDGLFNVRLGDINTISDSVRGDHAELFLGITIGTDDELVPRVQVNSVPDVMENYVVTTPGKYWDVPTCEGHLNENASWSAIPGLSIDIDLNETKTIWVDFSGLGESVGSDQYIYSNIFVDGELTRLASGIPSISGCRNSEQDTSGNPWCGLSNVVSTTLGPGNHTIDARVDCKSNARVYGGTLRALVFP